MKMPIPEFELRSVEKLLADYCIRSVPPRVRHKVRLKFITCGDLVTLYEERPYFRDTTRLTRTGIAQFEYDDTEQGWRLYCRSREEWHAYGALDGLHRRAHRFEELLDLVKTDPTGIFWG